MADSRPAGSRPVRPARRPAGALPDAAGQRTARFLRGMKAFAYTLNNPVPKMCVVLPERPGVHYPDQLTDAEQLKRALDNAMDALLVRPDQREDRTRVVKYNIVQLEKGEEGTEHLQGYMILSRTMRGPAIVKMLANAGMPGVSLSSADDKNGGFGRPAMNIHYCSKPTGGHPACVEAGHCLVLKNSSCMEKGQTLAGPWQYGTWRAAALWFDLGLSAEDATKAGRAAQAAGHLHTAWLLYGDDDDRTDSQPGMTGRQAADGFEGLLGALTPGYERALIMAADGDADRWWADYVKRMEERLSVIKQRLEQPEPVGIVDTWAPYACPYCSGGHSSVMPCSSQ